MDNNELNHKISSYEEELDSIFFPIKINEEIAYSAITQNYKTSIQYYAIQLNDILDKLEKDGHIVTKKNTVCITTEGKYFHGYMYNKLLADQKERKENFLKNMPYRSFILSLGLGISTLFFGSTTIYYTKLKNKQDVDKVTFMHVNDSLSQIVSHLDQIIKDQNTKQIHSDSAIASYINRDIN